MKPPKNFEVAEYGNEEEVIRASQQAVLKAMNSSESAKLYRADSEIKRLKEQNAYLTEVLQKIASADYPSVADKTSWIVMTESICALARETLKKCGGVK